MKEGIEILSIVLSILPLGILNGQNSFENPSNKDSNNSNITRYTNITEISYGIGIGKGFLGSSGHSSFGIHTINGFFLNPNLSVGFGLGLDRLHLAKNLGETILPISLNLRYNYKKYPRILFFNLEGGYVYNLTGKKLGYNSGLGGFFIDPSIGTMIISFKKSTLDLSLGIKIQETTINYVWMPLPKYETLINLKTGIIF